MGYVTSEQLQRAREYRVLDYVLRYEADQYKRVGSGYRHKDHDSLAVSERGFYWHSREIKGKTALDYLVYVRGYGLVDAVCMLLNERPIERSATTPPPERERKALTLPLRHKDNRRVIAYLQSRGIDRDLIMDCINRGELFESQYHHNAVFLGKDEHGRTRSATMRSTTGNFKCDANGSDKRYAFLLPPDNPNSQTAACFESATDCLSHQTLCKQGFIPPFDGWRISLGGTAIGALEHFIKQNPQVTHIHICTDNDEAGELAATKIAQLPAITTARSPPVMGNDWNDALQAMQKAERMQKWERPNDMPSL